MTCSGSSSMHHIIKLPHYYWTGYVPSMTCNGLLLITPLTCSRILSIFVCNPLTVEYVSLPPCSTTKAFLPPDISVGLGFAPMSKQYKVVCVTSPSIRLQREIMVYTLGVDKYWRVIEQNMDFNASSDSSSMFYVDGKIYFLIREPKPLYEYRVLSFDVESEKKRVIKSVPGLNYGEKAPDYLQFVQLAGSCRLSLFLNYGSSIEAWELTDCDSGEDHWDRRYNIGLGPDHPRGYPECVILGIWQSGERMLIILHEIVIFYDVRTDSSIVQRITTDDVSRSSNSIFSYYLCRGYKPSLISLRKYGSESGERFYELNQEELSSPSIQWSPPSFQWPA